MIEWAAHRGQMYYHSTTDPEMLPDGSPAEIEAGNTTGRLQSMIMHHVLKCISTLITT